MASSSKNVLTAVTKGLGRSSLGSVATSARPSIRPNNSDSSSSPRYQSSNSTLTSTTQITPPLPSSPYLSFSPHTPLPRTHSIHVATLHLAAHHPYSLDLYTNFSIRAASSLGIPTSNPAFLPTTKSLYTVLKSPFVHKKAQENFERKTHKRVIKVWDTNPQVIDLWLRYLRRNSIGGVGIKAYIYEYLEYGFGSKEIKEVSEQLDSGGDIQVMAKRLLNDLKQDIINDQAKAEAKIAARVEGGGKKVEEQVKKEVSEEVEKQGGEDLVEGSDDVVAGQDLPEAHPEGQAEKHTPSEADGGSRV